MSNQLVIDVTSSDIAVAFIENNKLVGINKEKSNIQVVVGDIYLGKVKKIMPGLNAAFINIGYEKDAFLHYLDLGPQFKTFTKFLQIIFSKGKSPSFHKFRSEPDIDKDGKISDVLKAGQSILVQVTKEPISTKGPRLTSEISIAGRNLILLPFSNKVSISQKIDSTIEKSRLKRLLQSIKPKNYGIIVRTVAESKKVATFDTELRNSVKKWETAVYKLQVSDSPQPVLSEISRVSAILRDVLNYSFNNIIVNNEVAYREIREYINTIAPEKQKIVKLHKEKIPVFEKYGVELQIKALFGKTVSIRSGAYLVIEHTEALHVIDVNSGNRSKSAVDQESNALEVNLIAAEEIARQLRLRDMGGIIVVDFIDMQSGNNRQAVYEKVKEAMSTDRTKHNILPLSKFGLMQITRQRVRPEMNIETMEVCPTCKGDGKITPGVLIIEDIENQIKNLKEKTNIKQLIIKTHPFIAAFLKKGYPSKITKWNFKFKCRIKIIPVQSYNFLEYHFFDLSEKEISV